MMIELTGSLSKDNPFLLALRPGIVHEHHLENVTGCAQDETVRRVFGVANHQADVTHQSLGVQVGDFCDHSAGVVDVHGGGLTWTLTVAVVGHSGDFGKVTIFVVRATFSSSDHNVNYGKISQCVISHLQKHEISY
jgi:hypothetical protein